MQQRAAVREELAAPLEVEGVVTVAPIGLAAARPHHPLGPQPAEVIRDQVLRQLEPRTQLAHPQITAGELGQQEPPSRMPREPEKAGGLLDVA